MSGTYICRSLLISEIRPHLNIIAASVYCPELLFARKCWGIVRGWGRQLLYRDLRVLLHVLDSGNSRVSRMPSSGERLVPPLGKSTPDSPGDCPTCVILAAVETYDPCAPLPVASAPSLTGRLGSVAV